MEIIDGAEVVRMSLDEKYIPIFYKSWRRIGYIQYEAERRSR